MRLGRRIYDNLRKAMAYILAIHVPIAGLALIPLLFGLPLVFWPLHIAFLEMVIDPVCSIVFEAEGEEADTMRRPPRAPSAPLFTAGFVIWSLLQGVLVLALVAGGLFVVALRQNLPEPDARALAFAALVATNLGLVLVNRSLGASVFTAFTRPNAALWWVVAATAAILTGVILFPPARELFHFGPLHGDDISWHWPAASIALLLARARKATGAAVDRCASSANRDGHAMNTTDIPQREPTRSDRPQSLRRPDLRRLFFHGNRDISGDADL